eukprot:c5358_g1_i1.p1 GENE.c5358_g1_i1~~c5358_g1_i1.p1  ORF type:complete len:137 (+),score=28.92 c5358_g1_i1:38-412(+)
MGNLLTSKKVTVVDNVTVIKTEQERAKEVVEKHSVVMTDQLRDLLTRFFDTIDTDHSLTIDREEAAKYWGNKFAKINTDAMFKEVDGDGNGQVSRDEWFDFWQDVRKARPALIHTLTPLSTGHQ